MSAVAIVPYGHSLSKGLAGIPLDALIWPLGRPDRLASGTGTVGDMAPDDHLVTFPRTALWYRALPRCRTSLMIVEPRSVHARHMRLSRVFGWRFHRILTRDAATLRACRNARFFPFAMIYLDDQNPDRTKSRGVSLIASGKRDLEGHRLRHAVVEALGPEAGVDVMGRGYRPFGPKEEGLAPYRYSVVIENERERGYMSEKIIDALLCDTIPIYWGAPDVGDYFDLDGIIRCDSLDDILAAIARTSPQDYAARGAAIRKNREAARHFGDFYRRAALLLREDAAG